MMSILAAGTGQSGEGLFPALVQMAFENLCGHIEGPSPYHPLDRFEIEPFPIFLLSK